jgi:hypothetical protein
MEKMVRGVRLIDIHRMYIAMVRKAKAHMRDRAIAAAKEKDPFLRIAKRTFVTDEELR